MITREVIESLYKQYPKSPKSADCLDIALLFDNTQCHDIAVDMATERLTIGSVSKSSPFSRIAMRCINAIVLFDEWVAIVMHSSILFLNRHSKDVSVHIKAIGNTWVEKLRAVCAF
jgi:hypothetical protein